MFLDEARYFWFIWLTNLKLALAVGLVAFGSLITLCAVRLSKIIRLSDSNESETTPGTGLEFVTASSGVGDRT